MRVPALPREEVEVIRRSGFQLSPVALAESLGLSECLCSAEHKKHNFSLMELRGTRWDHVIRCYQDLSFMSGHPMGRNQTPPQKNALKARNKLTSQKL